MSNKGKRISKIPKNFHFLRTEGGMRDGGIQNIRNIPIFSKISYYHQFSHSVFFESKRLIMKPLHDSHNIKENPDHILGESLAEEGAEGPGLSEGRDTLENWEVRRGEVGKGQEQRAGAVVRVRGQGSGGRGQGAGGRGQGARGRGQGAGGRGQGAGGRRLAGVPILSCP
jgi:hypothetical protein